MPKTKRPAMLMYVADVLSDEKLGACSPASRGIWWDMLMLMHKQGETGVLTGTSATLARLCRCTLEEMFEALVELSVTGTANVECDANRVTEASHVTQKYKNVTVVNRRMKRLHDSRKSSKERTRRWREKKRRESNSRCDAHVAPPSSSSSSIQKRRTEDLGDKSPNLLPLSAAPVTPRKLTVQQQAVDSIWKVFKNSDLEPPKGGACARWWKLYRDAGKELDDLVADLEDIAGQDKLIKGTSYVFSMLKSRIREGKAGRGLGSSTGPTSAGRLQRTAAEQLRAINQRRAQAKDLHDRGEISDEKLTEWMSRYDEDERKLQLKEDS